MKEGMPGFCSSVWRRMCNVIAGGEGENNTNISIRLKKHAKKSFNLTSTNSLFVRIVKIPGWNSESVILIETFFFSLLYFTLLKEKKVLKWSSFYQALNTLNKWLWNPSSISNKSRFWSCHPSRLSIVATTLLIEKHLLMGITNFPREKRIRKKTDKSDNGSA